MMSDAKYLKIFDIGLQNTFVYRWNFLLRALFGIVPLVGTVFIWQAMFAERADGQIAGYDFRGMIFYFLLVIVVDTLVSPTEDEWQIAADIREGQISALLIKPMSYLGYRTCLFLASRVVATLVTMVPVAVIFFWFREFVTLPASPATWLLAAASTAMAALIQFYVAYALAMFAFWILEISTIIFILYSFEYFLGGHIFPLDIMPAWIQAGLKWLPFTYELFFPVAVFLEKVQGRALWEGLAIQAGWVLLAWLWAQGMWRQGVRHYQAAGG